MSSEGLKQSAINLEATITKADRAQRLALQPRFSRVIDQMSRSGEPVPARLRSLNAALLDEAIEDRFDNMPV